MFTGARAETPSQIAPGFLLPTADGQIQLASLQGKLIYLDFWASWCGPCRKSFPWMNTMQSRYGAKGLVIVAINLDKDRRLAERFLAEVPAGFIIAYDATGATAEAYDVMGMPSSYLIDDKGHVRYTHIGFREISKADLESRIKALLARENP